MRFVASGKLCFLLTHHTVTLPTAFCTGIFLRVYISSNSSNVAVHFQRAQCELELQDHHDSGMPLLNFHRLFRSIRSLRFQLYDHEYDNVQTGLPTLFGSPNEKPGAFRIAVGRQQR